MSKIPESNHSSSSDSDSDSEESDMSSIINDDNQLDPVSDAALRHVKT